MSIYNLLLGSGGSNFANATGGTVTVAGNIRTHTFTAVGSDSFVILIAPSNAFPMTIEVLGSGGGGACAGGNPTGYAWAGDAGGGGGGAGGYIKCTAGSGIFYNGQTIATTIGTTGTGSGTGATYGTPPSPIAGGASIFGSYITANGGSPGTITDGAIQFGPGGAGGTNSYNTLTLVTNTTGASGTTGYSNPVAGSGGSTILGTGGTGGVGQGVTASAATGFGAGGGGGCANNGFFIGYYGGLAGTTGIIKVSYQFQ
jgi:hypothetical protein